MEKNQETTRIEDGYNLTEAEIDKRIAECDMLFPVHHEGIPVPRAMAIVMDIMKHVDRTGAKVLYAHRYEPDGITNLLVKTPPGMTPQRALQMLISVGGRVLGVSTTKTIEKRGK